MINFVDSLFNVNVLVLIWCLLLITYKKELVWKSNMFFTNLFCINFIFF